MNTGWFTQTPTEPLVTPVAPPTARPRAWRWRGGLEADFASEVGTVHPVNEDCCVHAPSRHSPVFCAVADGVGGGAHGDVASNALIQHCVEAPPEVYRDRKRITEWLQSADAVVREALARRGDRPGASTLVAAWFLPFGRVHLTNVGDCRAYRLRPRLWGGYRIELLTEDQTYANLGGLPPPNRSPHDPARMVGVGAVGAPPVLQARLREGEALLLCSDGLHKFVPDAALAEICGDSRDGAGLGEVCRRLVSAAKQNGSHDDVSALLVRRNYWFGAGLGYWLALLVVALLGWFSSVLN